MKLMIVVLRDDDAEKAVGELVQKDHRVTRLASTGGFLRRGNTTLMIGMEEERIDEAVAAIRAHLSEPEAPGKPRATVFVLNVARFEQL